MREQTYSTGEQPQIGDRVWRSQFDPQNRGFNEGFRVLEVHGIRVLLQAGDGRCWWDEIQFFGLVRRAQAA
ncbi:MAG: hypothetical protein JJU06_06685 [Ectothiorhodospiraceae bacterium]|nr:hypothetical protein [Ectothiorhodospiraceae bacterium]MCH8504722.1 hypothetical protein [Ectothiorhodospiraceae bacterium]